MFELPSSTHHYEQSHQTTGCLIADNQVDESINAAS